MKNRHITNNIRLVLDLLDYADAVQSQALLFFLDFYKAFDTIEHAFLLKTLKLFGFGDYFINIIEMLYKDINSSVIINQNTTNRFEINRGIRQGCPVSPFLFLLVTELLALSVIHDLEFKGIHIFDREIKITQLADDTILFMQDKDQLSCALTLVEQFSSASGLKLNISKCEILPLHECDDNVMKNIPVKHTFKYLGIHITKNVTERQQLNYTTKMAKTKSIFNSWLQRDLSMFGRTLLSKADGLSHFVYPSLSLFINNKSLKEINKNFLDFIWKNKPHKLKKEVLSDCKAKGGLDFLDFTDTVNSFRVGWIRRCLIHPISLWFFIPNHIFNKIGGLSFVLKCNYSPTKLPVMLSKFHQQCLLAWKLCFIHNFSPHKTLIWNNADIKVKNKSLFLSRWFENGIHNIISLFDRSGTILTYEEFLSRHGLPVPFREFNSVTKAIPKGLTQLIKSHLSFGMDNATQHKLLLNGVDVMDRKCDNKHIRQIFQFRKRITPRGKFYWGSLIQDINWQKAWLLPSKYCITNKVKEVHFKILHKIYPVNVNIAKYTDISSACSFCDDTDETMLHLFFECEKTKMFLNDLNNYLFELSYSLTAKDFLFYYDNPVNYPLEFVVNFFTLQSKFFLHKQKWLQGQPSFRVFKLEMDSLINSLRLIRNNKKNDRLLCLLYTVVKG